MEHEKIASGKPVQTTRVIPWLNLQSIVTMPRQTIAKPSEVLASAKALEEQLVKWRRLIHETPELSFQESKTAALIASVLRSNGFEVQEGIGKTGVVADLGEGRTIAIRADMDALPIDEGAADRGYASKVKGVMHACGHDAHVACALGAATMLADWHKQQNLGGRVRMIFQPAEETVDEEGKSGAMRMLEAGVTEGVDAMIAMHVFPRIGTGKVAVRAGPLLAACDSFKIRISGTGGHGAYPEQGIDAVVIASNVIQALQSVISRRKSALDPAVLTIGGIKSLTYRSNIMSQQVEMIGSIRYFSEQTKEIIVQEIERACSLANCLGGSYELEMAHENPALFNDAQITHMVKFAANNVLGAENVFGIPPQFGADDFSYFSQEVPSCYFVLGTQIPGMMTDIHSPDFDINESALPLGTAVLTASALTFLGKLNA